MPAVGFWLDVYCVLRFVESVEGVMCMTVYPGVFSSTSSFAFMVCRAKGILSIDSFDWYPCHLAYAHLCKSPFGYRWSAHVEFGWASLHQAG